MLAICRGVAGSSARMEVVCKYKDFFQPTLLYYLVRLPTLIFIILFVQIKTEIMLS